MPASADAVPAAAATPQAAAGQPATAYDGVPAASLAAALGIPRLHLLASVASTMDVAHAAAAAGAPAGTLVLADTQTAGRGRQGRRWQSEAGQGIWATVVERPADAAALEVMSLRVGLAIADALQPLVDVPVGLKWPNDLLVAGRKLGGVLVEARWRDGRPEWVAIGVGINVRPPAHPNAVGLGHGAARLDALARLVPAVRAAARCTGVLTGEEHARYEVRDVARGRRVVSPVIGVVTGVDATGAIVIDDGGGPAAHRAGSLAFAEEP